MGACRDAPAQEVEIDKLQDCEHSPCAAGPLEVSVALCTFNGARFVREQVRSICLQTRAPLEIVLSDDGSQDNSIEVARATVLECKAARPGLSVELRVLQNAAPLRVTKNFEQAVRACRGDLIALSDQDDVWTPTRLERMVAQFEARPELLLLHSDARLVAADGAALDTTLFNALEVAPFELEQIHQGHAFDVLLRRNLVTGATLVLRRSLLQGALPFPPQWLHDEWLAIIAAAIGTVDVIADPLIEYRQHGANQVGAKRPSIAFKIGKAFVARGTRYQTRLDKAVVLEQRLAELADQVSHSALDKIRGKVAHQRFRAALPKARLRRLLPVMREGWSGRYSQFGQGVYNAVRDLLEPG